jgi:hypothetical protein
MQTPLTLATSAAAPNGTVGKQDIKGDAHACK